MKEMNYEVNKVLFLVRFDKKGNFIVFFIMVYIHLLSFYFDLDLHQEFIIKEEGEESELKIEQVIKSKGNLYHKISLR